MDLTSLILYGTVAIVVLYFLSHWLKKNPLKVKPGVPDGTVLLYQYGRGAKIPSISPYCLKLETFLRMNDIPHKNDFGGQQSSKGKMPWMQFNGELVADSHFCASHLRKKLELNHDSHLTSEELAMAETWELMVEDSLTPVIVSSRWCGLDPYSITVGMLAEVGLNRPLAWFCVLMVSRNMKKALKAQGFGRHTKEEIYTLGYERLRNLSTFIGKKAYLMGDRPCEADCSVWGVLAQFLWASPGTRCNALIKEFPNLVDYCERMKEKFWPDWEQVINKPK